MDSVQRHRRLCRSRPLYCCMAVALATLSFVQPAYGQPVENKWPFHKPAANKLPKVQRTDWVRNEIDRFVLRKLEERQLRPAPEASKQTLIRRLYFDLIGLPPTPDEVDAFINDSGDGTYEALVDRLLDDKRYGERWARQWLDLARYADTAGYEGDPDLPHAWRYRDYVIDAFNNDKPYDQFIREQIAGDEFNEIMGAGDLPDTPPEHVVALTFLRLAPFTEPRGDETRHEMLSEMTSTVGSVFLGLTVGCAKCHDHKHDDISTEDFYRMKAFFATVQIPRPERGDAYQIGGPLDADFYREGEKEWATKLRDQLQQQLVDAKQELADLRKEIATRLGEGVSVGAGFGIQSLTSSGNDYSFDQRNVNDGQSHLSVVNADQNAWTIYTDGHKGNLDSLAGGNRGKWFHDIPNANHISLGQHTGGDGSPIGNEHKGTFAEILIYDRPLTSRENESFSIYARQKYQMKPTESRDGIVSQEIPELGLRFWLDAGDLDADPATKNVAHGMSVDAWVDKVGGLRLVQDQPQLQPHLKKLGPNGLAAVEFDDDFLIGTVTAASFLKDTRGSIVVIYSATHSHEGYGLEVGGEGTFVSTVINPSAAAGNDVIEEIIRGDNELVTTEERRHYEHLSTRDRYVKQHLKRLQPAAMSLRHSYGPPYEPGVPTSRIMIRGEYDNPGDVVEPGVLSVIAGHSKPVAIRLDPFKRWPTRSRRMALANWIADAENPLTHRVMINRLWHWHFGQGIVRTPSDFGHLSGGPSHKDLLDWLAVQFVENKWSIKAMHRLMVNSSVYRQSSAHDNPQASEVDPDNRLLWRFNRRRLDAEAIRDSVLYVSGRLNPEQFGLPIFPPLPGDVAEAVKYSESKWDTQYGPEGRKRSIYIYQQRTLTMPLMQTFDALVCDESRPRRRASVTPLQALAMYNGEFVNEESNHFATRVKQLAGEDPQAQIRTAFVLALGRVSNDAEANRLEQVLNSAEPPGQGLVGVCRILYNTNEFIYID